jgi:hypothetical protein
MSRRTCTSTPEDFPSLSRSATLDNWSPIDHSPRDRVPQGRGRHASRIVCSPFCAIVPSRLRELELLGNPSTPTTTAPCAAFARLFPRVARLLTTAAAARGGAQSTAATDQAPAVTAAIRDVLGWRPRTQDTKAFTAALDASFRLDRVEGHIEARYVPRGFAIQADLGGVTGGQASLYTRAQAAHQQITRILDALKPLRPDSDPEDCEAYRGLVRDSVRQIVSELGMPGGPRVELVDSAFSVLTGQQFGGSRASRQAALRQAPGGWWSRGGDPSSAPLQFHWRHPARRWTTSRGSWERSATGSA